MSDGKISYIVQLRDRFSQTLRGIDRGVRAMGRGIQRLGSMSLRGLKRQFRRLSVVVAGTTAGLIYYAGRASKAWLDKTKSLGDVRRALEVTGQATQRNQQHLANLSDWLQNVANVSDSAGDEAISYALRLGVAADEMTDFMKASLALSKVIGTDLIGGVRQLVRAQAGSTEMLSRYGIVLDKTKSKAEQYADLQQRMTRMFDDGIAKIDDAGSKWDNLKLRLSDVTKQMGRNIVQGLHLERVIDALRGGAGRLIEILEDDTNPFRAWLNDVREMAVWVASVISLLSRGDMRDMLVPDFGKLFSSIASDLNDAIINTFTTVINMLLKFAPVMGGMMGRALLDAWNERREMSAAVEQTSRHQAYQAWNQMGPDEQARQRDRLLRRAGIPERAGSDNVVQRLWQSEYASRNGKRIRDQLQRRRNQAMLARGAQEANELAPVAQADPNMSFAERFLPRTTAMIRSSGEQNKELIDTEMARLRNTFNSFAERANRTIEAPDSEGTTGPARIAARGSAGGATSAYGFLDHSRALGTEVREWKPSDKTLGDLHQVLQNIERNTKGLGDSLTQE